MKFALLILVLLIACERQPYPSSTAAKPIVQAAPANQFGHLSPIRLPEGEFFDGFHVIPAVWYGGNGGGYLVSPESYFFATTDFPKPYTEYGVHTLRNRQGVPVLIVIDAKVPRG